MKVVLITGSSKGIGKVSAINFAKEGYNVVITSRQKHLAEELANEINEKFNSNCIGLEYELGKKDAEKFLINQVINYYGKLDVLINNALDNIITNNFIDMEDDIINNTVKNNFSSLIKLTKYSIPYLKLTKGNIINIGSTVINRHVETLSFYTMLKGALKSFTTSLAGELSFYGIRVNIVNPGFTRSESISHIGLSKEEEDNIWNYFNQFQPLTGVLESEDVSNMLLFLASDKAKGVTGGSFDLDGGHKVQIHPISG